MREVNFHLLHFFEVDLIKQFLALLNRSRIFVLVCVFFASQAYRYTRRAKKRKIDKNWWAQVDSNHRPHAYQACALTTWAMSPCCYLRCVSPTCPSSSRKWWRWTGSNRWPPACKAGALPAELHPHIQLNIGHLSSVVLPILFPVESSFTFFS